MAMTHVALPVVHLCSWAEICCGVDRSHATTVYIRSSDATDIVMDFVVEADVKWNHQETLVPSPPTLSHVSVVWPL